MTFAEFKNTLEYRCASILEVFDENGIEFDDDYPEEEFERMNVVDFEIRSGCVSIVLK